MNLFSKESKMISTRLHWIKRMFSSNADSKSKGSLPHPPRGRYVPWGSHHHVMNAWDATFKPELSEYQTEIPEYPPIIDTSEKGQDRYFRGIWYDSVKSLPSVEQKLFELAIQQKLDLETRTLSVAPPTYNGIYFHKYITRTHLIHDLPKQFTDMNVDKELTDIKDVLCATLFDHYCNIWKEKKYKYIYEYLSENNAGAELANSLVLQCFKKLAIRNDYVFNSTLQQKPRIWSFWWHGGFASDDAKIDEQNLCFQFEDVGAFAIRAKQPLSPVLDMNHDLCSTPEVIDYNFHPDVFHFPCETKSKVAAIPAYWPGDPYEYPFLLVWTQDKMKSLITQLEKFQLDSIESGAAIISAFAWLNSVAMYHGFTPFHDITYPLVCQTVVTNGQDWNFFIYQMNTMAFHSDVDKKDRRNLCWTSGRLRLYETIENGQVKGINDEVFKVLLKFLHNVPQPRENVVMKPYLGNDTRTTEDIVYMRYLLRKMYTRVPLLMDHQDEVPAWVKIYKLHPDAPPTPLVRLE